MDWFLCDKDVRHERVSPGEVCDKNFEINNLHFIVK